MANIKSAIKRIQISKRNNLRNQKYKLNIKNSIKIFLNYLDLFQKLPNKINKIKIYKALNIVYSKIDKAKKIKILNHNKAVRKKLQLLVYLKKNCNFYI